MSLTIKIKLIIILSSITAVAAIAAPTTIVLLNNNKTINFTLLDNAGVMIEAKGYRIYIDPINLPNANYSDLKADAILITHDHGDHCQSSTILMLQKEDTLTVFPEIMTTYINDYDGTGAVPGDTFQVGPIEITCFYMYTESSHARSSNYTSYIIDIDGFTFFHAGDSYNIAEYDQLTGTIDVALLPLGPGCQTMCDMAVVNVIDTIQPTYFIPIHYADGANDGFVTVYGSHLTDYTIINLAYFESYEFKP